MPAAALHPNCLMLLKLAPIIVLMLFEEEPEQPEERSVAATASHWVTVRLIHVQSVLRMCTAGAAGQVRQSSCERMGWTLFPAERCWKHGTPGWKAAEFEGTARAEPLRRSRFLEESETDSDIKEGSGFPCASALFLGDWNVLQEQHELSHSVMALPPGTVQACLTCPNKTGGVGSIPSHTSICRFRNVLNCFPSVSALSRRFPSILRDLWNSTSSSDFLSYVGHIVVDHKKIACIVILLICSSDTSRCVAEKKYTEQQAKKLFPQVFVPVCNPDGTYSEVTETLHKLYVLNSEASLLLRPKLKTVPAVNLFFFFFY